MADPTPNIGKLIEQYQASVLARDAEAMVRLTESYARVYSQIAAQADALIAEVERMQAQGVSPTQTQIRKLARYQRVMDDTKRQLERYGAVVEDEVSRAQVDAARLANENLPALMIGILDGLPPDVASSIMSTWGVLPDDAVTALVGALQEGSPLAELFERYGEDTARQLGDILVRGLASGIGARKVADEMRRVLGIPLSDALRISRTEIMRSFRAATLADYRANAHIVRGWIWHSALDRRTCMGCIAMHGTEHTLSEELDDHPNGRCAAVPITVSPRDIGIDLAWEQEPIETGEAWFERQPEALQREMMGPGKYAAWKDGKFRVSDMVTQTTDARWGTMRHERSLTDLLGGRVASDGIATKILAGRFVEPSTQTDSRWWQPTGENVSPDDVAIIREELGKLQKLTPGRVPREIYVLAEGEGPYGSGDTLAISLGENRVGVTRTWLKYPQYSKPYGGRSGVLAHEVGHGLVREMTPEERTQWAMARPTREDIRHLEDSWVASGYANDKDPYRANFPSYRAAYGVDEDVAESYRVWSGVGGENYALSDWRREMIERLVKRRFGG